MKKMRKKNKVRRFFPWLASWGLILLLVACPGRKPPHKVFAERQYVRTTDTLSFSFLIPKGATLTLADVPRKEGIFVDLFFPQEKARLYCTYHAFPSGHFRELAEESRKLVYFHSSRADAIREELYENPTAHVYGILYSLEGRVATPLQLSLTDSVSYFFHASLYFDQGESGPEKGDTLTVLTDDLKKLMETFKSHPTH